MASAAGASYEAVKAGLARAIRTRRRAEPPGELARELLAYHRPGHVHLVGIDHAGETAVYHAVEPNEAVFVTFDADGLADGGPVMGSFDGVSAFEAWVAKMGAYWGWRHPRYR